MLVSNLHCKYYRFRIGEFNFVRVFLLLSISYDNYSYWFITVRDERPLVNGRTPRLFQKNQNWFASCASAGGTNKGFRNGPFRNLPVHNAPSVPSPRKHTYYYATPVPVPYIVHKYIGIRLARYEVLAALYSHV